MTIESKSVFSAEHSDLWKYRYSATLHVGSLAGGFPLDPERARGWLKHKLGSADLELAAAYSELTTIDGMSYDEAVDQLVKSGLCGFKRLGDEGLAVDGRFCIEGRHVKAAIKEAVNVAVGSRHLEMRNWGGTKKYIKGFVTEHVMVPAEYILITDADGNPVTEATAIETHYVRKFNKEQGQISVVSNFEVVRDAFVSFEVIADYDFDKSWPTIWVTAEQQGLGANRSQGFGRFAVVGWDPIG